MIAQLTHSEHSAGVPSCCNAVAQLVRLLSSQPVLCHRTLLGMAENAQACLQNEAVPVHISERLIGGHACCSCWRSTW